MSFFVAEREKYNKYMKRNRLKKNRLPLVNNIFACIKARIYLKYTETKVWGIVYFFTFAVHIWNNYYRVRIYRINSRLFKNMQKNTLKKEKEDVAII